MTSHYDAQWVETFYDEYGEKEWNRLIREPEEEVKLHVHRYYLEKYIQPGLHVLEIGAAAGRFTRILVELGARVTVADLSSGQLDLNRKYAAEYGFEHGVEDRLHLDMCDMSVIEADSFDVVVCYGGPLSYVFDKAGDALREIKRVLKPVGVAMFSVMSLWGAVHKYLDGIISLPVEVNRAIIGSGDLCPATYPGNNHHCHMYRAKELEELLTSHGLMVLEMTACNCLSTLWNEKLAEARKIPEQWNQILEFELQACREPGCVDMGTHTIAVTKKENHHA
ncbi:MAG: class I SAM-dependent methyltransferase [Phycisphaerae bacterium]|nr:class I SAM-dependent methyltransferase [Phycisphaerae bacterium]